MLRGIAVTGLGGLAGYTGSVTASDSDSKPDGTSTDTTTNQTTEKADESLDAWRRAANDSYPVQLRDYRFDDPSTVRVGHLGTNSFWPAAMKILPGTTITWAWDREETAYNVVATDGTFDSGEPVVNRDSAFQYTFEEEGNYRYVSEPHAEIGMKGLVVVESIARSEYPKVDRWLADTSNYDGSVLDHTASSSVDVTVGARGNASDLAFDPAAIKISPGTTVNWTWSGNGGPHSIRFKDADFGVDPKSDPGKHFVHTFTETGIYRYECGPHSSLGGRGAIVVE
ncbi:halocyanin hcpA [Haloferax mucosum ATCC BAA-1512]|uniref:Halocyanin hcpA n=1 Tax=Haloferax mucosum ATCC BAA-1512 TaxID=662479 RepID=M0IRJ0_9EURY|nr:halocyanin hcpA [Haloferax mucosum ATCC BAA-1512]